MARSDAERQALKREREALGLQECVSWIPGKLFEPFINGGALTDEQSQDKYSRGEIVALAFEAWVQSEMSQRDAQPLPILTLPHSKRSAGDE